MKVFLIYIILTPFCLLNTNAQPKIYTSLEVDDLPVIENCQEENPNCFQESLKIYIQQNINIKSLTKYASAKAYAQFVVMESGEIKDIKIRTTNQDLKKEAYKLLNKLDVKSPAMLNGAPVRMIYTTPISFSSMSINTGTYNPKNDLTNNPRPSLASEDAAILPLYNECKSSSTDTCFEDITTKRILSFLNFSKKNENGIRKHYGTKNLF
ncbi:energy transducer TonB [Gillisia marina]|uniref:energy transducer TonB n=1 Tax=Gillisia marina TaxID=1167637 RepID=UPI00029B2800|nr:energy transducer TonB [Gillisia marina]